MISARQIYLGVRRGAPTPQLPYYAQVDYILSTGTQWIELPFGFDKTDEIIADFSVDAGQVSDKYINSPLRWNTNNNRFGMGVHNNVYTVGYGAAGTGGTNLLPRTTNDGQIHHWTYSNQQFSVTDVGASLDVSAITFGGETDHLKLFYGYASNTFGKIAAYKHVKGSQVACDMIPVIFLNESGQMEGALYDRANPTVGINPDGSARDDGLYRNRGTGAFVFPQYSVPTEVNRYVQNGLVAMWDSKENVGVGRRDIFSTTWADIVGGNTITMPTASGSSYTWGPDGLSLTNASNGYMAHQTEFVHAEAVVSFAQAGNVAFMFGGDGSSRVSGKTRWLALRANLEVNFSGAGKYVPNQNTNVVKSYSMAWPSSNYDSDVSSVWIDGQSVTPSGSGMYGLGDSANAGIGPYGGNYSFYGKILNVRLYNRALTAAEIAANYAIDKARFNLP